MDAKYKTIEIKQGTNIPATRNSKLISRLSQTNYEGKLMHLIWQVVNSQLPHTDLPPLNPIQFVEGSWLQSPPGHGEALKSKNSSVHDSDTTSHSSLHAGNKGSSWVGQGG